eukprot:m.995258 g.995258  ORF g.995258 m.995258 type:complete len:648 (-) comp24016_c0_seq8:1667-3610(-)
MSATDIDSNLLWSSKRLDREKAVSVLVGTLGVTESREIPDDLKQILLGICRDSFADVNSDQTGAERNDGAWERIHGGLMAVTALANVGYSDGDFVDVSAAASTAALSHKEPRVREQAGLALAALASACATTDVFAVYCKNSILDGIRNNMERDVGVVNEELRSKLASDNAPLNVEQILHQSAGWRTLETSCKALLEICRATKQRFTPHITQEVVGLITATLQHTNRFVRETAFYICGELSSVIHENLSASIIPDASMDVQHFDTTMSAAIATGLSDNWSQVRMAASVAARQFLQNLPAAQQPAVYQLFLPPMALNRYYVAEGVRLYSQETWKLMVGERGKVLVETHIADIVAFYVLQADAANHAVREAACACIAELGLKVDVAVIREHVPRLLDVLIECFQDESWPVRDAACIACGRFVSKFPVESGPRMEQLYKLFLDHVCDNIWSVRENAAVALAQVVTAFGEDAYQAIKLKLQPLISAAKEQKPASLLNANLANVTTFGVAPPVSASRSAGDEDGPLDAASSGALGTATLDGINRKWRPLGEVDDAPTDRQQFSCGSLAPKLKRKGGCKLVTLEYCIQRCFLVVIDSCDGGTGNVDGCTFTCRCHWFKILAKNSVTTVVRLVINVWHAKGFNGSLVNRNFILKP